MTTSLPYTTVTVHEVNNIDLEKFIQENYPGVTYDFAVDQECCGNDSVHVLDLDGTPPSAHGQKRVADFAAGKHVGFVTRDLLQDMCSRCLIPAGKWLVTVSW